MGFWLPLAAAVAGSVIGEGLKQNPGTAVGGGEKKKYANRSPIPSIMNTGPIGAIRGAFTAPNPNDFATSRQWVDPNRFGAWGSPGIPVTGGGSYGKVEGPANPDAMRALELEQKLAPAQTIDQEAYQAKADKVQFNQAMAKIILEMGMSMPGGSPASVGSNRIQRPEFSMFRKRRGLI